MQYTEKIENVASGNSFNFVLIQGNTGQHNFKFSE